ncbi:MAG: geranylgeranylglycerol-phosphate geranylgeranyltransferase [Candidatus Aenigmarchaeota archaeon]|nr:geranylgeranylglycerol-phosphate geranylgeranyltransferase [Candidatus Aenigmarchaeota archaeon]
MNPYLEIIRPHNGLMAALAVLVAGFILTGSFSPQMFYGALVVFFVASVGFILNDYFDYEIDKINEPKRPLPSGRMKKNTAIAYTIALTIPALAIAQQYLNIYCVGIAVLNIFLEFIYAWKLKRVALVGNLIVSWLVASTFVFGGLIFVVPLAAEMDIIWILAALSFLSNLGREIYGDVEDFVGDKTVGAKTLPVILGKKKSSAFASLTIIAAVLLSALPYYLGIFGIKYLCIVALADLMFLYSLTRDPRGTQKWTRIAMFVALVAFVAGSL